MKIEQIIRSLRVAMTDARQNESHFESWMILNEAICDAIDALAEQPAQQEPVAWMYEDMMGLVGVRVQKEKPIVARPVTPLYTSPPAQRTWVGLSDEEVQEIWDAFSSPASGNIVRNIEAKLKEKNT